MVRVMATGVFDLLHLGHLYFLEEAKKLGDELVVVVATDKTAKKMKHIPITSQDMRVRMVGELKPVDKAVLGYEDDRYRIVKELKPDIIALGYDQKHDEDQIKSDLKNMGLDVKVVRLEPFIDHDLDGTRKIIRKVIDWYIFQSRIKEIEGKSEEDIT
ncbi:MAG: FAD synthase [Methanomassiliicoccales archaeon]|nr:MAG: FAD synthase [Methanomassiliicoccales archaeon]